MLIAVPRETCPGERRVALTPATLPAITKLGLRIVVESGVGVAAGHPDQQYVDKGADVAASRAEAISRADVVVMIRALGANPQAGHDDLPHLRAGQTVIGLCDPLGNPQAVQEMAQQGVNLFALEMIPRITRAQSMDVLSSMATVAGYKAVLLAANHLPRFFPMFMTAAGTVTAAKVLVIGAGVAGLQAIATAKRLGAIVHGYDVRPAAMEQIESLGAKAMRLDLDTQETEDRGGYAKELSEAQQDRQRELLADVVAQQDVCITTAAVPGRPSPRLVTADAVRRMAPGSVVVDLAAERGGNCEGTKADEVVSIDGVTILGPTNLPSEVPGHASQMYAKNLSNLLAHLVKDGSLKIDLEDEITRDTLVASEGNVTNQRIKEMLGIPATTPPEDVSENDEYELE